MKTFLAIFTETKLNHPSNRRKRYAFNTDDDIKVGDLIKCNLYHQPIQVTRIIRHYKKWYDPTNGKLTNSPHGDCEMIRSIRILDPQKEKTIVGYKKER